jgi:hypothetical protein
MRNFPIFCRGWLKLVHTLATFYDHLNIFWRLIHCLFHPFKTTIKSFSIKLYFMLQKILYLPKGSISPTFCVQGNWKWETFFCRGWLKLVQTLATFYDHLNIIWRHIQCPIYPFKTKIEAFLLHCILCFIKLSTYLRDQFHQHYLGAMKLKMRNFPIFAEDA